MAKKDSFLTPLYDSDKAENKYYSKWSEEASSCLTVNFAHAVITVFLSVVFYTADCRRPIRYSIYIYIYIYIEYFTLNGNISDRIRAICSSSDG